MTKEWEVRALDGVYRMGARHYSTVLGRFFQREPMTLIGPPNPTCPLSANPYIYSHNSPTTTTDISGLDAMGMSSTYSEGILYPPENHDPQPFVPMPDPDPGFEGPDDFFKRPGMMAFQIPGGLSPWWDRRFPAMPLPDICMGLNVPEFWATPEQLPPGILIPGGGLAGALESAGRALAGAGGGRPYGPGRQLVNVGGGSGGGGGGASGGRGGNVSNRGRYGQKIMDHPNFGYVSMGASYGSGQTQEQSDEDFNQAWKDSGIGRKIVGQVAFWTGVAVFAAATITLGAAILGSTTASGMLANCPLSQFLARTIGRLFIRRGMTVYRAFSGSPRRVFGQSWTNINPRLYGRSLYRKLSGLGENEATHVAKGILTDTKGVTTRFSFSNKKFGNPGGLFEIVIPDPESQVASIIVRLFH